MNYERIYREFIADRLTKQPVKPEYFEKHHIIPRSLGGDNSAANLIRLSAEDHYLAHLLLAKIHGGNQWQSVWCMVKMLNAPDRRNALSAFAKRRMFDIARRKSAAHKSVSLTGTQYRHRMPTHTLHHMDGRIVSGSLIELSEVTGVSIASVSRLASRKQGMTRDGWYMFCDEYDKSRSAMAECGVRQAGVVCGVNRKKVKCVETGKVFDSISEATKQLGIQVKNAFKKGRAKAGGFTWEYA